MTTGTVAPRRAPKRVQHTSATMARAQQLRDGGWSYGEIQKLLIRELGVFAHRRTIQLWCSERARETARRHDLDSKARARAERNAGRLSTAVRRPEQVLARIRALRDVGLSLGAIARVIALDLRVDMTPAQIRYALEVGRIPGLEGRS